MCITVNGIEVRSSEIKPDISVKFSDLTKEAQIRLFSENKDTFLYEALTSDYSEVHNMAINSKIEYSAEAVNDTISSILKTDMTEEKAEWIRELIDAQDFKLNEEIRKKFSNCPYWQLRVWVAKDKYTSEQLLNRMFLIECVNFIKKDCCLVLHAVIQNKNFKMTEQLRQRMRLIFNSDECHKIMIKISQVK